MIEKHAAVVQAVLLHNALTCFNGVSTEMYREYYMGTRAFSLLLGSAQASAAMANTLAKDGHVVQ